MSTQRDELLARLLAQRGFRPASLTVPPRPDGVVPPLTSAQRRLWFLDRLTGGDATYVMPIVHRLRGPLDTDALTGAVRELVRRHESLRTAIVERDGQPAASVLPAEEAAAAVTIDTHDLSGLPESEREPAARAYAARRTAEPVPPHRAPLLRAALVRLAADDHLLVLTTHHIAADDQSIGILIRDLATLYTTAAPDGGPPATPDPAVTGAAAAVPQFGDYAVWAAGRGSQADAERFWTDHLAGSPPLSTFPGDRPRPAVVGYRGASRPLALGADLSGRVRRLARELGATPFVVLAGGLLSLLGRYTDQRDAVIGAPVANRPLPELETVVGMFANTVALRGDLTGEPTVREYLTRVRETCHAALDAAEVPLERVIELVNPDRDAGANPLFQVMLVVNPAGTPAVVPGLAMEPVGAGHVPARFDLTVILVEHPDGFTGQLDYRTDLYDPATVDRIGAHLRRLLGAMADDPDRPLWTVPLLDGAELDALAGSEPPAAVDVAVPDLVAARAAADPDAVAVIAAESGAQLSYGELLGRADRLAADLREAGVGPDTVVGLTLAAGIDAAVGVLGIMRAGGAYLPLDPGQPAERTAALLADAGCPAVVGAAPPGFTGTVHAVPDTGSGAASADAGGHASRPPGPDDLAYVIYTSGSTGRPKGVQVTRAGLANLTAAFIERHGFGPGQRLLMVPPLAFDASVGDVFPALVSGATLVVPPDPATLTGRRLAELVGKYGITAVDTASALWQRWVDDLTADDGAAAALADSPLSVLMVGGEAVPAAALRAWARLTGGRITVYNHYGPTEATVCATTLRTVDGSEYGDAPLPIGRPLPGVRCHVLDPRRVPVPPGVAGELHIGGSGVARGYVGDPALTADRFVVEPALGPGRLYRTGDLVRWRADGVLEFLGRVDRQVKIRGNRVEPGEIEAALRRHPHVCDAVVVPSPDRSALIAYTVPRAQPPDAAELRDFLAGRLPPYLVPARYVPIDAVPLTRHGKVDFDALPAPPAADERSYVEPRTDTEITLAAIWAEALGVERVGRHDDFFALGGHSLGALAVAGRVRAACGVDVPLVALYRSHDLAAFASTVDQARDGGPPPVLTDGGPDLHREARLPADVRADLAAGRAAGRGRAPVADPTHVLVTGGTGFLGAHLLAELLDHTAATAYCLVRADSPAAGHDRLRRVLDGYRRWRPEYADRIVALPGDLARHRFGWDADRFDDLARRVDAVYHSAGAVDFTLPYERLKPQHVTATEQVLRFAARRGAAVHHVSTLGVYLCDPYWGRTVRETDPPDDPTGHHFGYERCKWVADSMARQAREAGVPVTVYRPARISGDPGTGALPAGDFLSRMLHTFAALGCYSHDAREHDVAPVSYVAGAIRYLSLNRAGGGEYHFYNPRTVTTADLVDLLTEAGFDLEPVSRAEFYARMRTATRSGTSVELAPYLDWEHLPAEPDPPVFDCRLTEAAVAPGGLRLPPAADLVRDYVATLLDTGYLPRPGVVTP